MGLTSVMGYAQFSGGSGTQADPWQISTLQDLQDMDQGAYYEDHFTLTNDIDASPTQSWNNGAGFNPIGSGGSAGFEGTFNGNNYRISNLFINRPNDSYVGLFTFLQGGQVDSLGIINSSITGQAIVGGLAGAGGVRTVVTGFYFYGHISGTNWLGGICGLASGNPTFNKCHVNATFSSSNSTAIAGGISGLSFGLTVNDCYTMGYTSLDNSFGFIGVQANRTDNVTNSYTAMGLTGSDSKAGSNLNATSYTNFYWNTDSITSSYHGQGLTTGQMLNASNFSGFDFNNVWAIDPKINGGYPYLQGLHPDISDSPLLCNGSVPDTLRITSPSYLGNDSTSYQWQVSTDFGQSYTAAPAPNDTAIYAPFNPVYDTTIFKRITTVHPSGNLYYDSVQVNVLDPITIDTIVYPVECYGTSTGAIASAVQGGTGTYTYQWDNGKTTDSIGDLPVGTYKVVVTDDHGCADSISVSVSEPDTLTAQVGIDSNVSCFGQADGGLSATALGGSPPYTFSWTNGASTASVNNLSKGKYIVTITDAKGCTAVDSATISEPAVLSANVVVDSNASCSGASDGGLSANVTGGTPPYIYSWSNGEATASTTNGLAAGNYTLNITDKMGCSTSANGTITEPTALIINAFNTPVKCNGGSDGTLRASIFYDGFESAQSSPATYQSDVNPIPGLPEWKYENLLNSERLNIFSDGDLNPVHSGQKSLGMDGGNFGEQSIILTVDLSAHQGRQDLRFSYWVYNSGDENNTADVVSVRGSSSDTWQVLSDWNDGNTYTWKKYDLDLDSAMAANGQVLTATAQFKFSQSDNFPFPTDGVIFDDINIYHEGLSYVWNSGETTNTINGVSAGTYTVTATDPSGCTATASTTVTEPPVLSVAVSIDSMASCAGATDGGLTASASGGTPPYSYSWDNGDNTASTSSGLAAGTYSVTITDDNGCHVSASETITEPAAISVNVLVDSNASCAGFSDGGLSATATGGTPPYLYSWSNGENTPATSNGLAAGTYTITVTDQNGCQRLANGTVTEPAALTASVSVDSNASCFGDANGGLSASASGGTPPYRYSWNNGETTAATTNGLATGTYSVTITDNKGCQATASGSITEPANLTASVSVDSNASCFGAGNGGLSASASGGTPPYSYAWSNGESTASTTSGLSAGSHLVTITDDNGCVATATGTISQPVALSATVSVDSNASCIGAADGGLSVSVNGGTPPYSYMWSNGEITASTTNGLTAGTYSVTITDQNGCQTTASGNITEPTAISAMVSADSNASCFGATDGGLTVNASGGTPPYSFSWSNGETTASTNNGLGAGSYSVTITDNNGCQTTANGTVAEPSILSVGITISQNESCANASDGSLTASPTGGTPPYIYSWGNGSSKQTATGLSSGNYSLTVTDQNGCTASASESISVQDLNPPTVITKNIDVFLDVSGSSTIQPSMVDDGSNDACGIASLTLDINGFDCDDVGNNTVTLTATDANGLQNSATAVVTVIDTVNPTVVSQNKSIYLQANGQASLSVSDINNGSNDACGIQSLDLSQSTFTCGDLGTNIIYLVATDVNGNVDSTAASVTVLDTIDPVASAQNLTVYLDSSGQVSITPVMVDNGSSDNCPLTYSLSKSIFDCGDEGLNLESLSVMDQAGNSAFTTFLIDVIDTISPTVVTKTATVQLGANGQASLAASQLDGGSSDNCSNQMFFSVNKSTFDCTDIGTNTVTLTATDGEGNSSTAVATVIVEDNILPVAKAQNITLNLDANGQASASAALVNNGSSDNCSVASLSLDQTNFTCDDLGINSVSLTLTDQSGNSSTTNAIITVLDTDSPVVSTTDTTVYLNGNGQISITPSYVNGGTADNCSLSGLSLSKSSFDCSNLGPNTVTLSASDQSGNSHSESAVVTVLDTLVPTVITQNITVQLDANGRASITPMMVDSGSSDNCSISNFSLAQTSFNCNDLGSNTVTLTITDQSGNSSSATASVTVEDTVGPVVATQNITAHLDANGRASITPMMVDDGSSDNCSINNYSLAQTSFSCNDLGSNTVTLTVTDQSGNSTSATANVIVEDTVSPVVTTQNITVQLDANGQASSTPAMIDNGSSDNCSISTYSLDENSFDCNDIGVNTVKLTATDQSGNSTSATANVIVEDTVSPIVLTQNITVQLDTNGRATITPAMIDNGSSDNCSISNYSLDDINFNCTDLGNNPVTLSVTDQSGNISTAFAMVTVEDSLAPQVTAQNITVYLDGSGQATISASDIDNGSTDNCRLSSLSLDKTSFTCSDLGTHPVTLSVTDQSGNVSAAVAMVTVVDSLAPQAMAQNITAYLDSTGKITISASDIDNGSTDNCGISSLSLDKTSFTCSDLGTHPVTLSVTDQSGNVSTAFAMVNVEDSLAPRAIAQNVTVYLGDSGQASISASDIDNGSTDNCSISSLSLGQTSFTCSDLGTNLVTLLVTDQSGNVSTAAATVLVEDTISPIAFAQNITIVLDSSGQASISPGMVNNGSTDNCGMDSIALDINSFSCNDLGVNTVNLTVFDQSGNIGMTSASVTVLDTTAPIVRTQDITVNLDINGRATITETMINNGSTDNCAISSLTIDKTNFDCSHLGTNIVTLTAQDGSANSASFTAIVTVEDQTVPTVNVQNITAYLDTSGTRVVLPSELNNGSTDNCGIDSISLDIQTFDCADLGQNLVNFTATDHSGNSAQSSALITIRDSVSPTIDNLPGTITAYTSSNQCAAVVQWTSITATDNCGTTIVSTDRLNGGLFQKGITTVNVTATDGSGNSRAGSFDVVVLDTVAPVINGLTGAYTILADSSSCSGIVSWAAPVVNDNCGSVTLTSTHAPGDTFSIGTTIVTYTALDADSNVRTASFSVRVNDVIAPQLNGLPQDITVSADSGACSATVNFTPPSAIDNCSLASLTSSHVSGAKFPVGLTVVTFTATDTAGNSATGQFKITVEDQQKPVISSVPQTDTIGVCQATYNFALPSGKDNCGNVMVTQIAGLPSGNVFPIGTTRNSFRLSDGNGNDTIVSFDVTVVSQGQPSLPSIVEICRNQPTVNLSQGQDSLHWSGIGVVDSGKSFDPKQAGVGRHRLTYHFSDASGCVVSGTISLTVLPAPSQPKIVQAGSTLLSTQGTYASYQWYRDGIIIPGATSQTFNYSRSGNYQVIVANTSGCEAYGPGYVVGNVGGGIGLEEIDLNELSLFPNPSSGRATIDLHEVLETDLEIKIYSADGRMVRLLSAKTTSDGKATLDLQGLPTATYYLHIISPGDLAIRKLIIQ